jgi:hypothetical protein
MTTQPYVYPLPPLNATESKAVKAYVKARALGMPRDRASEYAARQARAGAFSTLIQHDPKEPRHARLR